MNFMKAIFGNYSEKEIKRIIPLRDRVLSLEEEYGSLSDTELRNKTDDRRVRPLTIFCPRPLPPAVRRRTGCLVCATSRCRFWAELFFIRAELPR